MVITTSKVSFSSMTPISKRNQATAVCFSQNHDSFESSQKKDEKPSLSKTSIGLLAAVAVLIGAFATKGKLWAKETKEVSAPKIKPAPSSSPSVVEASPPVVEQSAVVVTQSQKKSRISHKYYERMDQYYKAGNIPKAIEACDKSIKFAPNQASLYCQRGTLHEIVGDSEKAINDYEKAIELDPQEPSAYYNKASVLQESNPRTALNYINEAVRLECMQNNSRATSDTQTLQYTILSNLGVDVNHLLQAMGREPRTKSSLETEIKLNKKIESMEKQLEKTPDAFSLHGELGTSYSQLGDLDKAEHHFTKMTELSPHISEPYFQLGLLHRQKGDYEKALQNYNKAIELKPENPVSYFNRANVFVALGATHAEEALADVNKAIELKPDDITFYYFRAKLFDCLGKAAERDADMRIFEKLSKSTPPPKK